MKPGQSRYIYLLPSTFNLRLPGPIFDGQAALHQNDLRDYDPATGRYLERDPIGLWGGLNTYAYTAADPLSLIDALGLACTPGQRVLREEVLKLINKKRKVNELDVAFIGPVHAELGVGVEPSGRRPGFGIGLGPNLSRDIVYFVWERFEIQKGWINTRFFNRKYHCKPDDHCSSKEWDELRPDTPEQKYFLDVTHEWEYKAMRPSGYTVSTP